MRAFPVQIAQKLVLLYLLFNLQELINRFNTVQSWGDELVAFSIILTFLSTFSTLFRFVSFSMSSSRERRVLMKSALFLSLITGTLFLRTWAAGLSGFSAIVQP